MSNRINIYVSESLQIKLELWRREINLSAVAQRAFESEIDKLQSIADAVNDEGVLERLRASKRVHLSRDDIRGYAAGLEWVKNRATYEQIQNLFYCIDRVREMAKERNKSNSLTADRSVRFLAVDWIMGRDSENHNYAEFYGVHPEDLTGVTACFVKNFVTAVEDFWSRTKDKI